MEPIFLTRDEVLAIHLDQILHYGGDGTLRDPLLLDSALAQPLATFGGSFLHRDLQEMAAGYLFHIVQNHPFIDGNKRTGTVAAIVFLELNGLELTATWEELVELVLGVASDSLGKAAVVEFFQLHTRPLET
jgi:death-on-curing protein